MPFLILGIILLIVGLFLRRMGHHIHDHGIQVGAEHLMYAGIILIVFFGLIYRGVTAYF